ncbi:MAG TPA: hypothetical protein VN857_13070, partial [Chthoniobacterales bacterium]|nr:hypothetical protein [Chthoniobacterales bacterium]
LMRLRFEFSVATGLVRRSPNVAPSGPVRMNAEQNNNDSRIHCLPGEMCCITLLQLQKKWQQ